LPTAQGAGEGLHAANFHAAMMGSGFGAFEFGNETLALAHHGLAAVAHG
jgi:hypothetical protein